MHSKMKYTFQLNYRKLTEQDIFDQENPGTPGSRKIMMTRAAGIKAHRKRGSLISGRTTTVNRGPHAVWSANSDTKHADECLDNATVTTLNKLKQTHVRNSQAGGFFRRKNTITMRSVFLVLALNLSLCNARLHTKCTRCAGKCLKGIRKCAGCAGTGKVYVEGEQIFQIGDTVKKNSRMYTVVRADWKEDQERYHYTIVGSDMKEKQDIHGIHGNLLRLVTRVEYATMKSLKDRLKRELEDLKRMLRVKNVISPAEETRKCVLCTNSRLVSNLIQCNSCEHFLCAKFSCRDSTCPAPST